MLVLWLILSGIMIYLELVYHLTGFGFSLGNPLFSITLAMSWGAVESLIVGILNGKAKGILFRVFLWLSIVWTGAQTVYLHIFKQPMLWEAIIKGGQDAITNYWREALTGFLQVSPYLALMILPGVVVEIILHKKIWRLPCYEMLHIMRNLVVFVACCAACIVNMQIGKAVKANYYEDYQEFFDPLTVIENMGVLATFQRDSMLSVAGMFGGGFGQSAKGPTPAENGQIQTPVKGPETNNPLITGQTPAPEDGENATEVEEQVPVFVPQPNVFEIDFDKLYSLADNKKKTWLADYIAGQTPTMTNQFTGIFEGYNLIFLTAEGFSPYAVREDLTPTLYHMINTGFVFDNYYVPLWQTSTSDGEYINCTGLIPDGQFSMRKSADNLMPYGLAGFFNQTGLQSRAYHNNSLSYYDRHRTHPNLGYYFKACKLGNLDETEWGDHVFEMEGAGRWPASDYEMMVSTVPEYVNDQRFHVYYMTISGHMNYNFKGNSMSSKNREAVAELDMSENARAYIACNIELDKAMANLLEQLKEAGQLERTVIVLSADHYPYAMTQEEYEELAGKSLTEGKDMFRNNCIMWNAAFEEEPVYVHKACGSMDLLPTLLNLFGFEYDSRMYAGRDIFSDTEGMVIFNDRSFVTDGVIYNRKTKEAIWLTDENGEYIVPEENRESYLAAKQQDVKDRYQFSGYILQENYYKDIEEARIKEE